MKTIFLSDKTDDLVYIDDYHPTEINAVYQAVGELYPNKKFLPCFSLIYSAEQKILLMILRKVYLNLTSYCCWIFTLLVNYQWKELRQNGY
jgi:hypothetical protein